MKKVLSILLCLLLCMSAASAEGATCPACQAPDQWQSICNQCGHELGGFSVGEIVTFGRYEQDGNNGNGAEPLNWVILSADNGTYVMTTTVGIANLPFDTSRQTQMTWENSTLRRWLNGEFFRAAFTDSEAALIVETPLTTQSCHYQQLCTTTDRVYLLDSNEFGSMLDASQRLLKPAGALRMGQSVRFWWLRDGYAANMNGETNGYNASYELNWMNRTNLVRPVVTATLPPPGSTPMATMEVRIRPSMNVYLRAEPSMDSATIGTAQANKVYPCFEVSNGWFYIMLNDGTFGYVPDTMATLVP